jgi:hypothetical protein
MAEVKRWNFDPEVEMTVRNIKYFLRRGPDVYVAFEDYEALREKNEKLVKATDGLIPFLKHSPFCDVDAGGACECGLSSAVAEFAKLKEDQ